jgi:hypothetical protein
MDLHERDARAHILAQVVPSLGTAYARYCRNFPGRLSNPGNT